MQRSAPKRPKHDRLVLQNVYILYLFLLPAIVLTFLFAYLPMFSNYIAFTEYDFNNGWCGLGSPFVGLANFQAFLTDPEFGALIGRTLVYSVVILVLSFPPPLILALMFNELRKSTFKRVVQTVSYIPHFVSWVTIGGLIYLFLSTEPSGLVNNVIQFMDPSAKRIQFMQDSSYFLPLLVLSGLWKEMGWGTILFLAALAGIDPQLYEAAKVDGAGRWLCLRHITLPGLYPTICILLIFALGGLFGTNFDQVFNLQNRMIRMDTDTIGVYTYYQGLQNFRYAYSAAVGLFQGAVGFVLTMATNTITKKLSNVGII